MGFLRARSWSRFAAVLALGALFTLSAGARAQITPARMPRYPDIYGDTVVFSAEGDLWLGSITRGNAERLTTHEGLEDRPRFSPDGKSIAFSANYDGGRDVYVMPTEGGAPRRLTYDPSGADMVEWTPDGKRIVFRTRRDVPTVRLYSVPVEGGLATPLPMDRAAQAAFSPEGKRVAYCRFPLEGHWWKRYRGGNANHLWVADLEKNQFRRIDNDTINEQYPVWVGETVYFVSERDGSANLWAYDVKSGKQRRITSHDAYDVKSPATDGKRIVYEFGNDLYVYDIAAGKSTRMKLTLASDRIHARPHRIRGNVDALGIGPTGKRILIEGRGQLFTAPAESGEIRAIAPMSGTRSKDASWSPDGKQIAFISDRGGEEAIYVVSATGTEAPVLVAESKRRLLRHPVWSADSQYLAFATNAEDLWVVNVATHNLEKVAEATYGEFGDYQFSPDGKWLAYSRPENFNVSSLYLYSIAGKQTTRLTGVPTRDHHPVFDPTGKYLYFFGERSLTPSYDGFDFQRNFNRTTRIYAITLAEATPSPVPVESDEEPGNTDDAAKKPEEKKPDPPKPGEAPKLPEVRVDLEGITERILEMPIPSGEYSGLSALDGKVMYVSSDRGERTLKAYGLKERKEVTLAGGLLDYTLSADSKKMVVWTGGGIVIANAGVPLTPEAKRVDLSGWQIQIDPEAEWRQMFLEAWRLQRDQFYDPNLHGQDWEAIRKKYLALLPSIGARSELNEIIGNMWGEVNISHEFVGGGYQRLTANGGMGYGSLGADLEYDATGKTYRIKRLLRGDGFEWNTRSPLLLPGLNIHEGDYLLAINGEPLRPDLDPNALLVGQGGKTIALLVNRQPTREGARTVRVTALNGERRARYYDWIRRNQEYVAKIAGPNIGYIHLPDMQDWGISEFTKYFYANLDKDGLVIDVRYNGGGIVSAQILERLRRIVFEYDQSRYGQPWPYHPGAFLGRLVLVCNENTGSDGEYFSTGFRMMGLGPTCGMRTWGGYAAIGGSTLLDGGSIAFPLASSFTPDAKWLPDGTGFTPDVEVEIDQNAYLAGRDTQLDKAVELLKAEIQKKPVNRPGRQEPPSKLKAFPPNKP